MHQDAAAAPDLFRVRVAIDCGGRRHPGRVHAARAGRDDEVEYFVYHLCEGYIITSWHPRGELEVLPSDE